MFRNSTKEIKLFNINNIYYKIYIWYLYVPVEGKMGKLAHIFSKNILSDGVSEWEREREWRRYRKKQQNAGEKVSKIEFA